MSSFSKSNTTKSMDSLFLIILFMSSNKSPPDESTSAYPTELNSEEEAALLLKLDADFSESNDS